MPPAEIFPLLTVVATAVTGGTALGVYTLKNNPDICIDKSKPYPNLRVSEDTRLRTVIFPPKPVIYKSWDIAK